MTRVKICGITRPEDARLAVEAGADAIGMIFASSARKISPSQAKKIIAVLPPFVVRVGVFVDQDPAWIQGLVSQLGLDRVQFSGREGTQILRKFRQNQVIKALHPQTRTTCPTQDPAPGAGAWLVDAYVPGLAGGTGKLANWEFARCLMRLGKPVILSGGLTPDNVAAAIRQVRPEMVDVASGVESSPGVKDAKKVRKFIQAVRGLK